MITPYGRGRPIITVLYRIGQDLYEPLLASDAPEVTQQIPPPSVAE